MNHKMRKGLLTPADIIRYTPVKLDFNPCTFRELYAIEYAEAVRCIGATLWNAMVANLVDYSSARPYVTKSYAVGDAVVWRGGYRVALVETTQAPDYAVAWGDAPRFGSATYEDLFCSFLGPYLAYVALSQRLPYILTQVTDQGMNYGGRRYNAQDVDRIKSIERAVFRDRERAWQVLENFMLSDENREDEELSGWKLYVDEAITPCNCNLNTCHECKDRRPNNVGRYRFG